METFYASITNNLIFKGIKYKIGKRYPLINGKEIFHKWNDIDINNIYGKLSIYLVKVDKTNNYFKILKEIDYSEFLKSKDKKENLISAIKNRDKWSLSKFSDTSDMSQQVNTYIKNEKYLDGLIKLDKLKDLSRFSVKYLHNKYLDYLVENDINFEFDYKKISPYYGNLDEDEDIFSLFYFEPNDDAESIYDIFKNFVFNKDVTMRYQVIMD